MDDPDPEALVAAQEQFTKTTAKLCRLARDEMRAHRAGDMKRFGELHTEVHAAVDECRAAEKHLIATLESLTGIKLFHGPDE